MIHTEHVVVLDFPNGEVDILELSFERNEEITIGEQVELELQNGNKVSFASSKEVFTKRGWIKAMDLTLEDEILVY